MLTTVAITDEVVEEIENLRLDRDQFCPTPQFASGDIERIVVKPVLQGAPLVPICVRYTVSPRAAKRTNWP